MKTPLTRAPEAASALLITVFVTSFLTLLLGSFLYLTQYEYTAVDRSQLWNRAMVAAEAGVEEGLAMINRFAGTTTSIANWPERALLNGWEDVGGSTYRMQRTIGDAFYIVYITNLYNTPGIKSTGYVYSSKTQSYIGRSVAVQNQGGSYFLGMVLAKKYINITGNATFDSFNSQDPAYSTGGLYDVLKRHDGGNLGSIASNLVAAVDEGGSARIFGTVATGPSSTITFGGSSSSGSLAWVNAGTAGIQPGWSRNDLNVYIPDAPPLPGGTYFSMPSSGSVVLNAGGGTKNYVVNSTYKMVNYDYLIVSNGTVVIDARQGIQMSANAMINITNGGKLILYLDSNNSKLNGQGLINSTGYATNCTVYGKNTCTAIDLSGGAAFIGYVYAPYADITLNGGSDYSGGLVGMSFKITGNQGYHYDESLGWPQAGSSLYRVVSWKEVPP